MISTRTNKWYGQVLWPWYLSLQADVCGQQGQIEGGLNAIETGLKAVHKHETLIWESHLFRLKGDLLLKQSQLEGAQAEMCFQQALTIARCQQAKSWDLRAATSLAHLWQSQDKRQEAYDLLALVYGWFTEGFDTADLQDAKALLGDLA